MHSNVTENDWKLQEFKGRRKVSDEKSLEEHINFRQ